MIDNFFVVAPISIEKAAPSTSTHTPPAAVSPTATTSGLTTAACPVCDEVIDAALVSAHVEACLNSKEGSTSADGSDEEYETYTWCGQTRVRATTLMGKATEQYIPTGVLHGLGILEP